MPRLAWISRASTAFEVAGGTHEAASTFAIVPASDEKGRLPEIQRREREEEVSHGPSSAQFPKSCAGTSTTLRTRGDGRLGRSAGPPHRGSAGVMTSLHSPWGFVAGYRS